MKYSRQIYVSAIVLLSLIGLPVPITGQSGYSDLPSYYDGESPTTTYPYLPETLNSFAAASSTPTGYPTATTPGTSGGGKCGRQAGGIFCPGTQCCSAGGTCGVGHDFCGKGCQSGACSFLPLHPGNGTTPATPSSPVPPPPAGTTLPPKPNTPPSTTTLLPTPGTTPNPPTAPKPPTTPPSTSTPTTSPPIPPSSPLPPAPPTLPGMPTPTGTPIAGAPVPMPYTPDRQENFGQKQSCVSNGIVSLTFEATPSNNTNTLLDSLKTKNVKASFFVAGREVAAHTDALKRAYAEGHHIGLQAFSYAYLAELTAEQVREEVTLSEKAVFDAIGVVPRLFRFPYGSISPVAANEVTRLGYTLVSYNLDSTDWMDPNDTDRTFAAFGAALDGRDPQTVSYISLQHDMFEQTVGIVPEVIDYVFNRGFQIKPLNECLAVRDLYWTQLPNATR